MFSASPETVRREPREFHLRRSVGQWRDLAVCALCDGAFLFVGLVFRPRRICLFCRYEISLSSIYGEKICDHLARYRKRRSIGVPFLFFSFIEQGQIVILSGRQLRSLDQNKLDILVALFGNRCANRLLG